jgi:hypothetical protein
VQNTPGPPTQPPAGTASGGPRRRRPRRAPDARVNVFLSAGSSSFNGALTFLSPHFHQGTAAEAAAAGPYCPEGTADSQQGRTFLFGDYDSGRVVGCDDPEMIIGTHAFELSMTITPTAQGYGMLASHDRSCDGNFQFRLEIYQSMKVSLQCGGAAGVRGVTDGDPGGFRSELCSAALPLGQPSRVCVRRESDGRFKLLVNDALVSEHRSGPPADLRIGTIRNRAFRIGSRFPPGTGSEPCNTFAGTIRQAVLIINPAAVEEGPRA